MRQDMCMMPMASCILGQRDMALWQNFWRYWNGKFLIHTSNHKTRRLELRIKASLLRIKSCCYIKRLPKLFILNYWFLIRCHITFFYSIPLKYMKLWKYRHYKWSLYEIIGIAKHSETLEDMVVYKALEGSSEFWVHALRVRPLAMFQEKVMIDGKEVERFAYIGK